jgi:hypothetical protein
MRLLALFGNAVRTSAHGANDRSTVSNPATPPCCETCVQRLDLLERRVDDWARNEATRAAEHATMLDQLSRLYKRVAMRIARDSGETPTTGESVLSLRSRLGR